MVSWKVAFPTVHMNKLNATQTNFISGDYLQKQYIIIHKCSTIFHIDNRKTDVREKFWGSYG